LLDEKERRFNEQWKSAKVVSNGFSGLTEGQQRAFDLVKSGANLYLSGLGGTGKSYVLERMIKWAEGSGKNVIVCAPTGIAALNVGGSTIHRALEIGLFVTSGG
jgi:ATP-dependent DNA helicase PIF1